MRNQLILLLSVGIAGACTTRLPQPAVTTLPPLVADSSSKPSVAVPAWQSLAQAYDCESTVQAVGEVVRVAEPAPDRYVVMWRQLPGLELARAAVTAAYPMVQLAQLRGGLVAEMSWTTAERLARDPAVLLVQQDGRKRAFNTAAGWGLDRTFLLSTPALAGTANSGGVWVQGISTLRQVPAG
jgi:hypothetical protein